ncbi:hypothetical protein KVG29_05210 [Caldicoprobacter algeriensis]|uniref:hypothetical protein n=1 Tax=Caldicoprobacter algeriensis TaxID=699281 RepID=UPI00207A2DDC|nr:hypothetical protein [Caldicoprobacter algeriensis]MCM8900627.1 hypothetical protein [Caldicoprobacter algeriensis]
MKLTFRKTVLLDKLADELFASSLVPPLQHDGTASIQGTNEEVWIFVPDNTPKEIIDQITTIVNAHDPTPPPIYEPVDEEKIALVEAIIDLETRLSVLEARLNA